MTNDKRADLLKDEYIMLQQFYEGIDNKGLNIKSWSITVALATIGTGLLYNKGVLLVGFAASLVFWYLEAYWRGLSHFYKVRIKDIEKVFADGTWEKEMPLQVYATWSRDFEKSGDQTIKYMKKRGSFLPHVIIAAITLILYFFGGNMLPK